MFNLFNAVTMMAAAAVDDAINAYNSTTMMAAAAADDLYNNVVAATGVSLSPEENVILETDAEAISAEDESTEEVLNWKSSTSVELTDESGKGFIIIDSNRKTLEAVANTVTEIFQSSQMVDLLKNSDR